MFLRVSGRFYENSCGGTFVKVFANIDVALSAAKVMACMSRSRPPAPVATSTRRVLSGRFRAGEETHRCDSGATRSAGGELDSVISGLLKVAGREALGARPAAPSVTFESARALGDVWALTEAWKELSFSALRRVFRRTRHTTDIEALIRVMVLNRLCDPDSKLGVLRWLETVALPGVDVTRITHQQLLRSMDALMDHRPRSMRWWPGYCVR